MGMIQGTAPSCKLLLTEVDWVMLDASMPTDAQRSFSVQPRP